MDAPCTKSADASILTSKDVLAQLADNEFSIKRQHLGWRRSCLAACTPRIEKNYSIFLHGRELANRIKGIYTISLLFASLLLPPFFLARRASAMRSSKLDKPTVNAPWVNRRAILCLDFVATKPIPVYLDHSWKFRSTVRTVKKKIFNWTNEFYPFRHTF